MGMAWSSQIRLANPCQAYSWWVMPDLKVAAFVDCWGLDDPQAQAKPIGRGRFGGTFAPPIAISRQGNRSSIG